jgi:hypothetical protein
MKENISVGFNSKYLTLHLDDLSTIISDGTSLKKVILLFGKFINILKIIE